MDKQRTLQIIIGVLIVTILGASAVLIPYLIQQREEAEVAVTQPDEALAWKTQQSAESKCVVDQIHVEVTFSNTEPDDERLDMLVEAVDLQTGKSVDLGVVDSGGGTVTGVIETGQNSLNQGQVRFNLEWADGRDGTDSRTVNYSAVECETPEDPSPTPTEEATPTLTPTPTGEPEPTLSPTPTGAEEVTETPTPTEPVSPTITSTPSESKCELTIIPQTGPSPTPTPTATGTVSPSPTPTGEPSPTPTEVNYCDTPCQTDAQCRDYNSNWTCNSQTLTCRHVNWPEQENCQQPGLSCNKPCSTNSECTIENPDYICYNTGETTVCRHEDNPGDSNCQGVEITQTPTPTTPAGPTSTPRPTGTTIAQAPTLTPTPTLEPELPTVGTSLPTLVLSSVGLLIIAGALILAL